MWGCRMSIPAIVGIHPMDGQSQVYSHSFRTFTNGGSYQEMYQEIKEAWLSRIWGDHECHIEELPPGSSRRNAIMILDQDYPVEFQAVGLFQADFPNHLFEVEYSCHYVVWVDLLVEPHAEEESESVEEELSVADCAVESIMDSIGYLNPEQLDMLLERIHADYGIAMEHLA